MFRCSVINVLFVAALCDSFNRISPDIWNVKHFFDFFLPFFNVADGSFHDPNNLYPIFAEHTISCIGRLYVSAAGSVQTHGVAGRMVNQIAVIQHGKQRTSAHRLQDRRTYFRKLI